MSIVLARRSLTLLAVPFVLAAGEAAAAELTLKRVLLSSGGVGYFEYAATVTGNEVLSLPVHQHLRDGDVDRIIEVVRGAFGA